MRLNPRNHPHFVQLEDHGLTAKYVGFGENVDAGAVQAEKPIPRNCTLFYFEATVLESEHKSKVCIGFSTASHLLTKFPGAGGRSIGYRAEDGRKLFGTSDVPLGRNQVNPWEPYGHSYGKGDVVGCGLHTRTQSVFFTKNGHLFGRAGRLALDTDIFPTVSLHGAEEKVQVNFLGPFVFDIRWFLHQELIDERQLISREELPQDVTISLVQSYLLHAGFQRTLDAFNMAAELRKTETESVIAKDDSPKFSGESADQEEDSASGISQYMDLEAVPSQLEKLKSSKNNADSFSSFYWGDAIVERLTKTLSERTAIQHAIGQGDIRTAVIKVKTHYPKVLASPEDQDSVLAKALLYSQELVERLRPPGNNVSRALEWMTSEMAPVVAEASAPVRQALTECCGLLAYRNPEKSVLAYNFDLSRRLLTANAVNACILRQHLDVPVASPIEILLRHLIACREVIRSMNGNWGQKTTSRSLCHPIPLRLSDYDAND